MDSREWLFAGVHVLPTNVPRNQTAERAFSIEPLSQASLVSGKGCLIIGAEGSIDNHNEAIIRLTKREIEVLQLALEGKSSKEVADILCCSKRTVDFHLGRVYDKLKVSNRVQAMRRVALLGLLPLESDIP